jgi:hypothetical protein
MDANIKSLIESTNRILDTMATKEDIISIQGDITSIQEDIVSIRQEMATKNDLQRVRDEIIEIIRPTEKAVDKDAVTLLNHGKRITRIETHLALK